jgi:hypothetical protein
MNSWLPFVRGYQWYSVIYVSNNSMPQWLRPLLARALIDIMEGRPPAPLDAPAVAGLPDDLAGIAGTYRVDGVGAVTIEVREGRACVRVEDAIEYPAFPVGDGYLYVPGRDVWIGFAPTSANPFHRLTWLSIFHVAQGERTTPAPRGAPGVT